jgi:hypothetical protein
MLESQHFMWLTTLGDILPVLENESKTMSNEFQHSVLLLDNLYVLCTPFRTFESYCTEANLEFLCNTMSIVVGNGFAKHIPMWTYVVSQFHLFVLEAQYNKIAHLGPLSLLNKH